MSTPVILILALLLDAALGEPKWLWDRLPHPAVLMGRAVSVLDRTLNTGRASILAGLITLALLMSGAYLIGWGLSFLGGIAQVIIVAILLAQRSLVQHVSAVAEGLRVSLGDGRSAVAMIVSRDTTDMDQSATARAAIESAAENLSDGVIAPAFWFLVGDRQHRRQHDRLPHAQIRKVRQSHRLHGRRDEPHTRTPHVLAHRASRRGRRPVA